MEGEGAEQCREFAKAYRSLESLFGADKAGRTITLPTDPNDQAQLDQLYGKLGRPESPAGYGLKIEGASDEFTGYLAGVLHKAGVSPAQAKVIADGYAERQKHLAAQGEQDQAEWETRSKGEWAELERAWGAEKPAKVDLASRAARQLGWDKETMSQIEQVLGTKAFVLSMLKVGEALREDAGVGDTSGSTPGLPGTPEAARTAITARMQDKEFMAKVFPRDGGRADEAATKEWIELHKIANPQ